MKEATYITWIAANIKKKSANITKEAANIAKKATYITWIAANITWIAANITRLSKQSELPVRDELLQFLQQFELISICQRESTCKECLQVSSCCIFCNNCYGERIIERHRRRNCSKVSSSSSQDRCNYIMMRY